MTEQAAFVFDPPAAEAAAYDPESDFKCASSEVVLALSAGPMMFDCLVKSVLGSESFRHRKAWIGILTFSWLLDRMEREGRLISTPYYYGARSPEEGEYKGYTNIFALSPATESRMAGKLS
jgi:hypothetical protein